MATSASIADLPVELFAIITKRLSTHDFCALRTTCRTVEFKTRSAFAKAFFSQKQFMLTTASVAILLDISRHPTFSQTLERVVFATDSYNGTAPPVVRGCALDAFQAGALDQYYLSHTGKWRDVVVEAFQGLPMLRTLDVRDYNSQTRFRDGHGAAWLSAGAVTIQETIGHPLHMGGSETASTLFQNLLLAAAEADVRITSVETILKRPRVAINELALHVVPSIRPMLSALTKVHLDMFTAGDNLKPFLAAIPNVTWLRLNFKNPPQASLFHWLAGMPKQAERVSQDGSNDKDRDDGDKTAANELLSPDFPHLKQFELGMCHVTPAILGNLLDKFDGSLKAVSLWRMGLEEDAEPRNDGLPTSNLWDRFLRGRSGCSVRKMTLGFLTQFNPYSFNVAFSTQPERTKAYVIDMTRPEWAGVADPWAKAADEVVFVHPNGDSFRDPMTYAATHNAGDDSDQVSDHDDDDDNESDGGDQDNNGDSDDD